MSLLLEDGWGEQPSGIPTLRSSFWTGPACKRRLGQLVASRKEAVLTVLRAVHGFSGTFTC